MRSGESRLDAIDGLRAVAALSVLAFHAWLYSMPQPSSSTTDGPVELALSSARVGLVLFFVLTGFLLYRPWVRRGLAGNGERVAIGSYLRRRAARILPAYYVALAASVVLLWGADATPGVRLPEPGNLLAFVFFAQNFFDDTLMSLNPPMWTLAVEVCFYLLLPVVGRVALALPATRAAQSLVPAVLLAIGVAYNAWLFDTVVPDSLTKVLPAMLPYFALGMLAAVALEGRAPRPRLAWALLAAGAAAVAANALWRSGTDGREAAAVILRDLPAALGFAAVIAGAAMGAARGVLAARPVVALGTVSYGFYLWHVPLLLWLRSQGLLPFSTAGALAVALPLTVAVAAASWLLVERPFLQRARRARTARQQALEPTRPAYAPAGA